MRNRLARAAAVGAAVTGVLMAAGCAAAVGPGTAGRAASALLPAVQAAVKSARSVHITGSVTSASQAITLDVSFAGNGGLAGTMAVNGASFGLLTRSGQTYIKVNAAFLRTAKAPAAACTTICGKFVEVPAADAQTITGALSMRGLIQNMFRQIPAAARSSSVRFTPGNYDGEPALRFSHDGYTLIVAGKGTPYPLAISGRNGEYLDFSDWNDVTLPPPPAASQLVNLSEIG
jgi:hypothetical protein